MVRNVVLLCLDTARYDYYTEYAPRLHSRAETTFERCIAASSWSMPSHASIFTGKLPHVHGIHPQETFSFNDLNVADTFLGSLPKHTTLGISANTYASSSFGFDALFDEFIDYSPSALFQSGLKPQVLQQQTRRSGKERYTTFFKRSLTHDYPVQSLANGFWGLLPKKRELSQSQLVPYSKHDSCETISSLARDRVATIEEPYVLFINAMDAHAPFEPLRQYDSLHNAPTDWHSDQFDHEERNSRDTFADDENVRHYRQLYAASIDYLDRTFNTLVDDLLKRSSDETTIIVFSDHGENLGYKDDEYLVGHNSVSNAIVHTPGDVINPPELFPERITKPISHLDFGDIVKSIANEELFPMIERSVVPTEVPRAGGIHRGEEPEPPHLERMARAVVSTNSRTEWDSLGNCRRFDRKGGFPEGETIVDNDHTVPDEASEFFTETIEQYLSTVDKSQSLDDAIDPATEQRLQELGYL